MQHKSNWLGRRLDDETGAMTVWGLFATLSAVVMGGLAVDAANGWRVQAKLQIATDAAALAAATLIDDTEAARAMALTVARKNLGPEMTEIRAEDIRFGRWDEVSGRIQPVAEGEKPDSVSVTSGRTNARSNPLGTYLLRFAGVDVLEVGSGSTARARPGAGGEVRNLCATAMVVSSGALQAGGSNTYDGDVCLHGATGVHMGGNDWFGPAAKVSSGSKSQIFVSSLRSGSTPADKIKVEQKLDLHLLPNLQTMWTQRWALFAGTAEYYTGDLFPDYLKDAQGRIRIVRKSGWWSIQPGEVKPHTIYLVNGGAQFSGGVDASKVAFIVNGGFGTGGGHNLTFSDVFIMAKDINLAGNVVWGNVNTVCTDQRYSAYLFGLNSLSMGGWGKPTPIHGVVGVSPSLQTGGAMTGTGVYFETSAASTSLGGNWNLTGCGGPTDLESEYEIVTVKEVTRGGSSRLVR